ncbi:MAG: alpha-galactosidase [Parvularculaceae bacterium]|nr:alpha-galactosidase [Parvularculaceae bacterium]
MTADAARYWRLDGPTTTVMLERVDGSAPVWRYWGPRLNAGAEPPSPLSETRPRPTYSLDRRPGLSLLPTGGLGWFGPSALRAHRDGRDSVQAFECVAAERGDETIVFTLQDSVTRLAATVALTLDASDVLAVATTLVNEGDVALVVDRLASACLPLPSGPAFVRSFVGRHNLEFVAQETPLGPAIWSHETRRGVTSHDAFPGALAAFGPANWRHGRVYAAQLAWSGDHEQAIETLEDGTRMWTLAERWGPGEIRLAPGEQIRTAEVLATVSDEGFDGAAQRFHAHMRRRTPETRSGRRPVHLNTWEGVYFAHRIEDLKDLADAAAAIGVERFVLDDGWFEGRDDDSTSLGDWRADPRKYPQGLAPLADHVLRRGMEFGLWVEPEMVSPRSALFEEHPDWALAIDGRPQIAGRNQLALDVARKDVRDHLFDALDRLLSSLPIAYLKWDHNRALAPAARRDGAACGRAQVEGFYALLDRVRAAHPQVEIESCASGGGRIDAGVATRASRFWASDCLDARARRQIQRGFLHFLPPETMGSHVGASPAHSTGRAFSISTRALVAMQGHFGVELDPRRLSAEDRAELAAYIRLYKELRPVLHSGSVWRGEAGDGVFWQAQGDRSDFIFFVWREEPGLHRVAPSVRLDFVDPAQTYRVQEIEHPGLAFLPAEGSGFLAEARARAVPVDGGWLRWSGLPVPPLSPDAATLYRVTAT